jgi:hypothetical protein
VRLLALEGFRIDIAQTGMEGLARAGHRSYDAIVHWNGSVGLSGVMLGVTPGRKSAPIGARVPLAHRSDRIARVWRGAAHSWLRSSLSARPIDSIRPRESDDASR